MILAGQVRMGDFYMDSALSEMATNRAAEYILKAPGRGAYAPACLVDSSQRDLRLFVIWSY